MIFSGHDLTHPLWGALTFIILFPVIGGYAWLLHTAKNRYTVPWFICLYGFFWYVSAHVWVAVKTLQEFRAAFNPPH